MDVETRLTELTATVAKLVGHVEHLSCATHQERLTALEEAIHGNGRAGLRELLVGLNASVDGLQQRWQDSAKQATESVRALEAKLDAMTRSAREAADRATTTRRWIAGTLIAALAASAGSLGVVVALYRALKGL